MRLRCHVAAALVAAAAFLPAASLRAAGAYSLLRIAQPANEATIHDNAGRLEVGVALAPPLDAAAGDPACCCARRRR